MVVKWLSCCLLSARFLCTFGSMCRLGFEREVRYVSASIRVWEAKD
jgi:hypothetical protein